MRQVLLAFANNWLVNPNLPLPGVYPWPQRLPWKNLSTLLHTNVVIFSCFSCSPFQAFSNYVARTGSTSGNPRFLPSFNNACSSEGYTGDIQRHTAAAIESATRASIEKRGPDFTWQHFCNNINTWNSGKFFWNDETRDLGQFELLFFCYC